MRAEPDRPYDQTGDSAPNSRDTRGAHSVTVSPDCTRIVTGGSGGTAKVSKVQTGTLPHAGGHG